MNNEKFEESLIILKSLLKPFKYINISRYESDFLSSFKENYGDYLISLSKENLPKPRTDTISLSQSIYEFDVTSLELTKTFSALISLDVSFLESL